MRPLFDGGVYLKVGHQKLCPYKGLVKKHKGGGGGMGRSIWKCVL